MGSFATPLSGLTAAQDQLQSVSNNLANADTDGYKDQTLTFSDIFSASNAINGAGDPIQTGSGVAISSTDSNFTDGSVSSTGTASNMALSGNGFFVTEGSSGVMQYTRSGDFTTNNAGQLVTPSGDVVLGYPAAGGVVNTSAPLQPLQVTNVTDLPTASTTFNISANLSSSTAVNSSAPSSTVTVYDSQGTPHTLTISYTKTAADTWSYNVTIPTADLQSGGTGTTSVGSGSLVFSAAGTLTSGSPGTITIQDAAGDSTLTDGATAPLTLAGSFNVTQTSSASATTASTTNGSSGGTLTSYAVQSDGTIEGTFSGGSTVALGQVAVASFANNQGLVAIGDNNYQPTGASGQAVIGLAGTGGRGTITGGAVELSNVDIATEFAKLIVAQQDYSANAKSITAFNQVSQATLAMIQ